MLITEPADSRRPLRHAVVWLSTRLPFINMVLLITVLSLLTVAEVERPSLSPDGVENLDLSLNLWTKGSFSEDGETPSYLREPLPIAVTALHLALVADVPESADRAEITRTDHYLEQVVRVNLYYIVGTFFGLWWLSWLLTKSHTVAGLANLGTWFFLVTIGHNTRNLLSETPGALLLVLSSGALVWLVQSRRPTAAVLAGVTLGALALTKAAVLYVALVAIPLTAVALVAFELVPRRAGLKIFALMALAFALTVTPWMIRNQVQVGDFSVAQRGGIVLYTRALKNTMSQEEYWGTFYAYAPAGLRPVFETLFGYEPEDLRPGGRYERLKRYPPGEVEVVMAGNVEDAVSYFGKAWALKIRLEEQMTSRGLPEREADRVLQQEAEEMIAAAPGKHLAMTLPFAWRGIWSFDRRGSLLLALTNLVAFGSLLALPIVAIWRLRPEWFVFSLTAVGLFWFHALLTHFIPRYSEPLTPLAVLSPLVLGHALFVRLLSSRKLMRQEE